MFPSRFMSYTAVTSDFATVSISESKIWCLMTFLVDIICSNTYYLFYMVVSLTIGRCISSCCQQFRFWTVTLSFLKEFFNNFAHMIMIIAWQCGMSKAQVCSTIALSNMADFHQTYINHLIDCQNRKTFTIYSI